MPPTARRNLAGAALLALLLPLALARAAHAAPTGPAPLRPLDERTLGIGESRNYFFPMKAGEYLRIDVEQNDDIDAGIRLYDSRGKLLFHGNSYTGTHGAETMSWIAEKAEVLRVEVYAWEEFDGRFRASVDGPRSPSAYDVRRTQASRELFEGIRLEEQQPEPLYAQAEEHHRRAVALWAGLAEPRWAVVAQRHLAFVLKEQGDSEQSYALYRSIWKPLLQIEEIELIGEAGCEIVRHLIAEGDVSEFDYFSEVVLARLSSQLPHAAARRAACMAFEAMRIGRLETAVDFLRFQTGVLSVAENRRELSEALRDLSRALRRLGRLEEALRVTKRQYKLAETPDTKARALVAYALIQIGLEKPSEAIQTIAEIVPTTLPLAVQAEIAYAGGWANFDAGNYASASELFRKSSELRPRGPEHAASWAFLALSEIERGRLQSARDALSKALEFPLLADASTRAFVHRVEAKIFYEEGHLREAVDRLQLSLSEMEQQRQDPDSEALRVSFWSTRSQHLEAAVNLLLSAADRQGDQHYAEQAFMIVDGSRAPALRERLQRAPYRQEESSLYSLGLRPELAQLDQKIADLTRRMPPGWRELRALFSRQRAEIQLSAALRRRPAKKPSFPSSSARLSLNELKAQLRPDEQFISFFLGRERSLAWIIDRNHFDLVSLPPGAEIERVALDLAIAAAESRSSDREGHFRTAASAFSKLVWAPLTPKIWAQRLQISPDGALHRVPFAVVADPETPEAQLVDRFGLSIAPSLASVLEIRRRQRNCSGVGLITTSEGSSDFSDDGRALRAYSSDITLIRATRTDVLGPGLKPFCQLHIASHGSADSSWPDSSALIFDGSGLGKSVYAFEIRELELSASLVTLAACESGVGDVRGEGLYGLTNAILGAGAKQVLASLWPIDNQATSELMEDFYDALGSGLDPHLALRRAQLNQRSRVGRHHPALWAAFQIFGAPGN
ncbi:MAG: CHAT domain-containing tetratricopeptide repeat protein [Thermoanaerobaculia bacterium]|nr:CHAT domain-containing tetratricopeptide repeat protein [Thermoanaerobaculia bacterium]